MASVVQFAGIGVAYVLAWLCYVPVFLQRVEEGSYTKGPVRFDDTCPTDVVSVRPARRFTCFAG